MVRDGAEDGPSAGWRGWHDRRRPRKLPLGAQLQLPARPARTLPCSLGLLRARSQPLSQAPLPPPPTAWATPLDRGASGGAVLGAQRWLQGASRAASRPFPSVRAQHSRSGALRTSPPASSAGVGHRSSQRRRAARRRPARRSLWLETTTHVADSVTTRSFRPPRRHLDTGRPSDRRPTDPLSAPGCRPHAARTTGSAAAEASRSRVMQYLPGANRRRGGRILRSLPASRFGGRYAGPQCDLLSRPGHSIHRPGDSRQDRGVPR